MTGGTTGIEGLEFSEGDRVLVEGSGTPTLVVETRKRKARRFRFYPRGRSRGTYAVGRASPGTAVLVASRSVPIG